MLLALNRRGFGAQVVATFANGRAEEFLWAKTLTPEEMRSPAFVPRIASRLRQLHDTRMALPGADPEVPSLWGTLFSVLIQARGLRFEDEAKQAAYDAIDFHEIEAEMRRLQAACAGVPSPCVFAHGDLLSGAPPPLSLSRAPRPCGARSSSHRARVFCHPFDPAAACASQAAGTLSLSPSLAARVPAPTACPTPLPGPRSPSAAQPKPRRQHPGDPGPRSGAAAAHRRRPPAVHRLRVLGLQRPRLRLWEPLQRVRRLRVRLRQARAFRLHARARRGRRRRGLEA